LRATPTRHVRDQYPIAATALAYQPEATIDPAKHVSDSAAVEAQPMLFANPNESRVIPFDQLTTPAEREGIRARAAQLARPSVVKSAKQEVSARRSQRGADKRGEQQQFDFFGKAEIAAPPKSAIQCGAPVAPPVLRLSAAVVDGFMVLSATLLFLSVFRSMTGELPADRLAFAGYGIGIGALSLTYRLMWCFANRDSFGASAAGLQVVDFDGNLPTQRRRFTRALSSLLGVGAAGLGVIWTLADADSLAWHDQISGTFPTVVDVNV
jgi:uncharacterized RDD family membrane protein YckC